MDKSRLKRGTIFRNLWAGYESYFIYLGSAKSGKMEAPKVSGLLIYNIDNKWKMDKNAQFYKQSLYDEEHYPVVGYFDEDSVIDLILSKIERNKKEKIS